MPSLPSFKAAISLKAAVSAPAAFTLHRLKFPHLNSLIPARRYEVVGTFLGILLCYGVVGPLSANMRKSADEHNEYLNVLRVLLLAFLKGSAPMIAIEMGRRAIPAYVRPSFDEMEKTCKNKTQPAEAAAA